MEKESKIQERLREKSPLIMAIVIGVALLLAIVIIASLLKLSFSTYSAVQFSEHICLEKISE